MSSCITGGVNSIDMNIERLNRLRSDCYVIAFIWLVLTGLFILGIVYLSKHVAKIIADYKKNRGMREDKTGTPSTVDPNPDSQNPRDKTADDEVYDESATTNKLSSIAPKQPYEYMAKPQLDFYKVMDEQYKEYNTLKTQYIANTYSGRENDDFIDRKVTYPDYDNYTYEKEKNE